MSMIDTSCNLGISNRCQEVNHNEDPQTSDGVLGMYSLLNADCQTLRFIDDI